MADGEETLSHVSHSDGGKHLETVASGYAMRMLKEVIGCYAGVTVKDFPILDQIGPQQPALNWVQIQSSQSLPIAEARHPINVSRPSPLHPL